MDDARPLVRRLFEFLEAYNQKRNPSVRDVSNYEKVWRWANVPDTPDVAKAGFDDPSDSDDVLEDSDEFVLRVSRPIVSDPPSLPGNLAPWVEAGWDDPRGSVAFNKERDDPDQGHLLLTDEHETELREWIALRDEWATSASADYAALQLFQWLWDVYSTLEREGERYELVIGDGILSWETNAQPVTHPLLIQRLQIEFDATKPSFSVTEIDRPPELYSGVLRALNADSIVIGRLIDEVNLNKVHPLGDETTTSFLRRAASELHPQGKYHGFHEPVAPTSVPQIVRAPVLFLRTRALGYEAAIQAIKEDLDAGTDVPDALSALVGMHSALGDDTQAVDPFEQGDETEDVLLTKEANREQLEIARRLSRYGAVLVQGPPGTGKTHTIANLIGHLLANGKSVLVTSHTTKALRVLRDKVVQELQPLCVSVLEGDSASNAQLANAVTQIGQRLSSSSEDQLRREADQIRSYRNRTLEQIADARRRLLEIVRGEYSAIIYEGREYSPSQVAQMVHDGAVEHSWIPGRVVPSSTLPLSAAEVRRLYSLNALIDKDDELELEARLPDVAVLSSPEAFYHEIQDNQRLNAIAHIGSEWWREVDREQSEIEAFGSNVHDACSGIGTQPAWFGSALEAALLSEDDARPWLLLRAALAECQEDVRQARLSVQTYAARLPEAMEQRSSDSTLDAILAHMRTGRSLPRFLMSRPWKQFISESSVLAQPPSTLEHFEVLEKVRRPRITWQQMHPRWQVLMAPFEENMPGFQTPADETSLGRYVSLLTDALEARPSKLLSMLETAGRLGFDLKGWLSSNQRESSWAEAERAIRDELQAILDSELARLKLAELTKRRAVLLDELSTFAGYNDPSRIVGRFSNAIRLGDPASYAEAFERLSVLKELRTAQAERQQYLGKLSAVAHEWTEAIRLRVAPHDADEVPSDPILAWRWRQLVQVLDERSEGNVETVIQEIGSLRERLREQTTQLIDRLAWAEQSRNTTPEARQALGGYVELIKKIGKGTGRKAPRLREAARRSMSVARQAVPVWIAPLSRAAEAFDPRKQRFDVVIIDEASQSDVLGLISWYLGDNVMVVGDDQQVTPDAVGERIDEMSAMISTYLRDIPNKDLYDGQASIYQLAQTSFRGVVRLREHFRCLPDIISFSNDLSYDGSILPLRDPSSAPVLPAVISHRVDVPAENVNDDVNEVEAITVASLLVACTEQPEYSGMTFGMMSLLGNKQAARVERILTNVIPAPEYAERRILCGIPPNFQGDERDVIFLSLVTGAPDVGPLAQMGDPGERTKKRYNVATSRARDQLWIVHSLDRQRDLKTTDLRWRLLEWAADPAAITQRMNQATRKADSPFEVSVLKALITAGYKVKPQYAVGGYRIDIVAESGSSRLAIECDGDRYHSSDEEIRSDLDRQALLERMGLRFFRLRGTEYYRNPDASIQRLFRALSEAGVVPEAQSSQDPQPPDELQQRIHSRAAELRQTWEEQGLLRTQPASSFGGRGRPWGRRSTPIVAPPEPPTPKLASSPSPQSDVANIGSILISTPIRPRQAQAGMLTGTQSALSAAPQANAEPDEAVIPNGPTRRQLNDVRSVDDIIEYFRFANVRVIDNRSKQGALWIYGTRSALEGEMVVLRQKGFKFQYSLNRGGWYLTVNRNGRSP